MGTRWSETRSDRRDRADCTICDAPAGQACRDKFWHVGRRWEIGITWPGARLGGDGDWRLDGACRATVEDLHLAARTISYRGACLGCGWAASDAHGDSNTALADALDHTLDGWRDVPIVERHRNDAPHGQVERWSAEITRLYDGLGLDARLTPGNGGVIRTLRQPHGTRSHHNGRFYDVCAGLAAPTAPVAVARPVEQLGLF